MARKSRVSDWVNHVQYSSYIDKNGNNACQSGCLRDETHYMVPLIVKRLGVNTEPPKRNALTRAKEDVIRCTNTSCSTQNAAHL